MFIFPGNFVAETIFGVTSFPNKKLKLTETTIKIMVYIHIFLRNVVF
jgi:hypothetical protein